MRLVKMSLPLLALLLATGLARAQDAKPTDPQIAHIAYIAGEIDLKGARLALKKSTNKQVRGFAQDMIGDHSAVNKQALELLKRLKVNPEANQTSNTLVQQAEPQRSSLAKLRGSEFDRACAENELAYHQTVNGALEATLIPSAANGALKAVLSTGVKIFQGHQKHAEQLVQTLKQSGA